MFYAEVSCQCTPVGSNNEAESTAAAVRTPSIYLNTAHPATCSGTVERWQFCFYRPDTHNESDRYRLTMAVYRRNNIRYELVESSLRTITRDFPAQSSNFSCQYLDLNMADRFNIETDDIVGACIFVPTQASRERMDIVSEENGYSLMQNNVRIRCGYRSMPTMISSSQFSMVDSKLMHLSAIIAGIYIHVVHNFRLQLHKCIWAIPAYRV